MHPMSETKSSPSGSHAKDQQPDADPRTTVQLAADPNSWLSAYLRMHGLGEPGEHRDAVVKHIADSADSDEDAGVPRESAVEVIVELFREAKADKRRHRVRAIARAGRAAVEAFRADVVRDCDETLRLLDGLGPWLNGAAEPEVVEQYRRVATSQEPSQASLWELEHLFEGHEGICATVIEGVLDAAVMPLDKASDSLRRAIAIAAGDVVLSAYDAAMAAEVQR
jgi:hypothetical protein